MIEIILIDDTTTQTLPLLNVPLSQRQLEGAVDVEVMNMDIYTDFVALKRLWSHTWKFLSEAEFEILQGFYERQFTLHKYPRITIDHLGVTNIPVRMTLSPQEIIDHCGTVEDVQVTFRESVQVEEGS